ncbi:MAG: peptide transporter permease [Ilumatobacteraceae bacterium]|nr:peptide transporter permease [Ilumatobacteraceae bacterium]
MTHVLAAEVSIGAVPPEPSVARRRGRGRRPTFAVVIATVVVAIAVITAVTGSLLAPKDPGKQRLRDTLIPPMRSGRFGRYVLGSDELGRDVLSRLIAGTRPLLLVVVVSVAAAALFGLVWGLIAGTGGRVVPTVMMRIADMQLSIPPVILAVILAVVFDPGVRTSIVAISLVTWPSYARVVRAETLKVRSSDYVALARVAGLGKIRVLRHHILPNIMNSFVVLCTLQLATAIIFAAALSFLGVGVQAPRPDWGNMLAGGTKYLDSWWLVVVPGVAITILVLSLNVIGDHVRDRFDPRRAAL